MFGSLRKLFVGHESLIISASISVVVSFIYPDAQAEDHKPSSLILRATSSASVALPGLRSWSTMNAVNAPREIRDESDLLQRLASAIESTPPLMASPSRPLPDFCHIARSFLSNFCSSVNGSFRWRVRESIHRRSILVFVGRCQWTAGKTMLRDAQSPRNVIGQPKSPKSDRLPRPEPNP